MLFTVYLGEPAQPVKLVTPVRIVPVQKYSPEAREAEEDRQANCLFEDWLKPNCRKVIEAASSHEKFDFNYPITGIEVETLIGTALGRARGVKRFICISDKAGMIDKLYLSSPKRVPTFSFTEKIGKRTVTVRVYCARQRPKTF
jgi:hypothetical protein